VSLQGFFVLCCVGCLWQVLFFLFFRSCIGVLFIDGSETRLELTSLLQVVLRRGFILQDFKNMPLWLPYCLLASGRLAGLLVTQSLLAPRLSVRCSNIYSAQGNSG